MRDLFHSFLDFKKAFDTVWHAGLWQVLRSVIAEDRLVQAIHEVFGNSSSAVLLKPQLRESLKTAVDFCQGCSLSTILFNLFLEKIVQQTLHDDHTPLFIGERPYATYDLPTTSILWAAVMVNFKTSPTDS